MAASILPARSAARVAPIEALREPPTRAERGAARRGSIAGFVVAGRRGGRRSLYGLFGRRAQRRVLVGAGAAVTFIGVAILSPLVARPLAGADRAPDPRLGDPASSGARTRCETRGGPPRRRPR